MCARFVNSQSFSYFDLWSGDNTGVSNLVERSFPVPCNFRCSFQFPHISYFQSLISLLHTSYYFYWSHSYFLLMSSNFLSDSAKTYRASFRWFSNSSEEKSKSLIASKTHRCPLHWWRCRAQACSSGWSARQPWGKHGASCSPEENSYFCVVSQRQIPKEWFCFWPQLQACSLSYQPRSQGERCAWWLNPPSMTNRTSIIGIHIKYKTSLISILGTENLSLGIAVHFLLLLKLDGGIEKILNGHIIGALLWNRTVNLFASLQNKKIRFSKPELGFSWSALQAPLRSSLLLWLLVNIPLRIWRNSINCTFLNNSLVLLCEYHATVLSWMLE